MAKKVQIGAIIEIETKIGKAYAQFSHYHSTPPHLGRGALLRILPGTFGERPQSFRELVKQREVFSAFFPLQAFVNRNIVCVVGHEALPEHSNPFPLFRGGNSNFKTGKVDQWWLWDGDKEWKVPALTDDQWDLPLDEIINDGALIRRIELGWTPRKDEAMKEAARAKMAIDKKPRVVKVRHFLLFKTEAVAERARHDVVARGMTSGGIIDDGAGCTLLVEQLEDRPREELEDAIRVLREIAGLRGGKYDGWDTAVAG